jgi:hypothetical protein
MRNWGGALAESGNFRTLFHAEQLAAGRHPIWSRRSWL